MTISIGIPKENDKPLWRPLWKDYLSFYGASLPDSMTDLTWERFQNPREPMHLLAAHVGERMVGFAAYVFHRSTWAPDHYCYLEDLFVEPAARSQGVGKALILAVKKAAQDQSATRLYWVTRQDNEAANALYGKLAELTEFVQYRMVLSA